MFGFDCSNGYLLQTAIGLSFRESVIKINYCQSYYQGIYHNENPKR